MKMYNNIKLSVKSAFFNLMVLGLIVLPATLFTQENPFIFMENNKFYHQCEEFYPVVVNYSVAIIQDVQYDFHVAPARCYCTPNDCEPAWYSCGINVNEWHYELKLHLEKIVDLKFNTIRLLGLGVHYNDNYHHTEDEVLQSNQYYIQQSDPNCYETEEGLVINSNTFNHQGDLLQEVIDIIKNNDIPLKLIILTGGGGVEMLSDDYSAYLSYMAERFKDEPIIFGYDLYNEPVWYSYHQIYPPNKYERTETCLQWYNTIKLNAPSHFVTIGSERFDVFDWDPGILPVDFISFHLFYDKKKGDDYEIGPAKEKYKVWLKWMSESFNLPIYIYGETGFPGINTVPLHPSVGTEKEQKEWAEFSLKYTRWYGTEGYSWWFYKDVTWHNSCSSFAVSNYKGIVYNENNVIYPPGSDDEISKPVGTIFENYDPYIPCTDCTHPDDETYYNPNPTNYTNFALEGHVQRTDGTPVKNVFIQGLILDQSISVNGNEHEGSMAITDNSGYYKLQTSFDYFRVQRIKFSYPGMELKKKTAWNTGLTSPVDIIIDDLDASQIAQKPDLETYTIEAGETETWDVVQFLPYKNIIIEEGAQLNITSDIFLLKDAKITVKQNGKLKIDGGRITCSCDLWQGIEVWGNSYQHQFEDENGNRYQGMLEIKNWGVIENAYNAVTLWKPGDWHSMGGIIQANEAYFYNNKRSAEFMSYQNFHPYNGGPMKNISYFKDCHFEVNDDYHLSGSPIFAHITMWDVDGISIRSSNFINSRYIGANTGYGIYTENAGYSVQSSCTTSIVPCPEQNIVRTVFEGLYAGIGALNSGSTNTIYVNEAEFNGNSYGVKLNTVDNATIIKSDFNVGSNKKDEDDCGYIFGMGIELINCNGYSIEDNEFEGGYGSPGTDYTGIRVYYPDDEVVYNEIYNNNEFYLLVRANLAEGYNQSSDPYIGLTYLCNKNTNNYYDFYVTGDGIAQMQGDFSKPAGNEFSKNISPEGSDFNNQAIWPVNYVYDNGFSVQNPENTIYVFTAGTDNSNTCPSNYGGGSGTQTDGKGLTDVEKQYYEQEFYDNLTNYSNVKALYESLKDGGNTEAMITEIETSSPEDMLELRAELLDKSPHLSEEVLKTASDKTDVLPDAVIFEILSANPDELKNEELLKYLEDKENPLPQYMIDILRALAGNTTYKTILQSQMAYYNGKKTEAAYTLLRNMLNDSITNKDEVRNWLDNLQSIAMDYQIVDSYLQEGNTTDALALIDMMPQLYNITGEDMDEYNRYKSLKQLQAQLKNEDRNIFLLTADEKSQLEDIVANSNGRAGMQARNILEFVYGNEYCDCPSMLEEGFKRSNISTMELVNKAFEPEIEARPNPAKNWTTFTYKLPATADEALLQVTCAKGQLVYSIQLSGIQGQTIWDTRSIEPGVYFYTLKCEGISKTGKIVIAK